MNNIIDGHAPLFPMRIDVHIRILAHICDIRACMRKYLLLAHFPAPAWPSLNNMLKTTSHTEPYYTMHKLQCNLQCGVQRVDCTI